MVVFANANVNSYNLSLLTNITIVKEAHVIEEDEENNGEVKGK